jgi:tetratricopeptide (TPR) repeat protein/DNA-binding XRE family transcriptional regulator
MEPHDDDLPVNWLRQLRKAAGLTQEELAERSGLSLRAIGNLERGSGRPYPRSVRVVATALGLTTAVSEELIVRYRRMAAAETSRSRNGSGAAGPNGTPVGHLAELCWPGGTTPRNPPQSQPGGTTPRNPGPVAGRATSGAPLAVVPRQLLAPAPHFAGRVAEMAALDLWLEHSRGAAVISAINGMAGVGKTALAMHWAHRVADRFPDGQLYANLRGYDPSGQPAPASEVIRRFLDALGVPTWQLPEDLDGQAVLFRSVLAGKRMLIVADNARDAAQVRPMLPGSPGSLLLVTSRSQLDGLAATDGARTLNLDVLTRAEAVDLLDGRLGRERLAAEPGAAAELVGLCAQLPLALVIAAARAATTNWPLAAHVAEIAAARHQLDAFDLGDSTADVRSVFSWSYRQLADPAARMFRLLGIHPGPDVSVPAAASLADYPASQARSALRELSQASLIAERAPGRYSLHDLLHAYATDLAVARETGEDRRAASARMLDHYLHTAQAGASALDVGQDVVVPGPPEPGVKPERLTDCDQALAWFDAEHKVLTAVTRQAARTGFDDQAQRLTWTMVTFYDRRGFWPDLAADQQVALGAGQRLGDRSGQARTHLNLGRAYLRLGQSALALANLERAAGLCGSLGDQAGQGRAHLGLSAVHENAGDLPESLASSLRALELAQAARQRELTAMACNNVGYGYARLGEFTLALRYCRQALDEARAAGSSPSLEASTWDSLGYVHHKLGDYSQASDAYQRALRLFSVLGASYLRAQTLDHLGDTYQAAGDAGAAQGSWKQALCLLEDLAHPGAGQVRGKLIG